MTERASIRPDCRLWAAIAVGCAGLALPAGQVGAQVTVSPIFVSSSEEPSEPILNVNSLTAYGVSAPVAADRIEVDGIPRIAVGDAVGAIAGATWSSLTMKAYSDSGVGHILVSGYLTGTDPEQNFAAVVHGTAGGPTLVLQRGVTPAPGTSAGTTFDSSGTGRINTVAQVAIHAYLSGADVDCTYGSPTYNCDGIWAGDPSDLVLIARTGDDALNVPGATYAGFGTVGNNSLVFNRFGQIAFVARLKGATIDSSNDTAIYRGQTGGIALVAREGDPVPGGGSYGELSEPSIGWSGKLAFLAGNTIYLDDVEIVSVGDPAPRGGTFYSLSFPAIDDSLVFRAEVNAAGLLDTYVTLVNGQLVEIVREGDVAPGTGGQTFTALYSNAVVNGCGHIPFTALLSNGLKGLWVYSTDGTGVLVALQGQPSPVGPNFGTVYGYLADRSARASINDGGYRYFNDAGIVVFRTSLSDGSDGLFRSGLPDLNCHFIFGDGFEDGTTSAWSSGLE